MKFFVSLLAFITLVYAQTNTRFQANVRITDPTGNSFIGAFDAIIYYSFANDNTIVRIDYDQALNPPGVTSSQGPIEVYNYADDERYLYCSQCELETWNEEPLEFLLVGGESQGANENINGMTCRRFTKANPSPNGVSVIWVDQNNGDRICRAELASGLQYDFSSFSTASDSELNIFNTFTGCPMPSCGTFVDFCLVFDESGSIAPSDFAQERDFGGQVIDQFTFDANSGAQACVVYYSSSARLVHILSADQASVRADVTGRSQERRNTATGDAMVLAAEELVGTRGRPSAAKLMLVLTDGNSNRGVSVQDAANFAEARGIIRIAIGVGPGVNDNEIQNIIPTPPSQVGGAQTSFFITDFNSLSGSLQQIVAVTCRPIQGNRCGAGCNGFCTCGQVCVCPDVCDDGDVCTTDVCNTNQNGAGCQFNPRVCDDNNACTTDSCNSGTANGCVYAPITCNDNNACTTDGCSTISGCTFAPISCDDNDACTNDSCDTSSGCVNTPVSTPGSPCLCLGVVCPQQDLPCGEWVCQTTDGMCDFIPTMCDDGDMCTTDACVDARDECVYTPINCDDGDACTDDSCVAASGCMNVAFNATERCDDQSVCTNDFCDTSSGCVNEVISCDDGNVCTTDTCNSVLGCDNDPRICGDEPEIRDLLQSTGNGDQPCYTADCDPALPNGCRLVLITNATIDSCGVCNGDNSTCGDGLDNTDLAAISGGVIAALVIAAVALCVLLAIASGKGGYDVYLKGKNSMEGASTNPLYNNEGLEGTNPMHEMN